MTSLGDQAGRHIPINVQYRVTFRCESAPTHEVCVEDYHLSEKWLGPANSLRQAAPRENILGKRGITADTARRLARLLKTSPQTWMHLQTDCDLHEALRRENRRAS